MTNDRYSGKQRDDAHLALTSMAKTLRKMAEEIEAEAGEIFDGNDVNECMVEAACSITRGLYRIGLHQLVKYGSADK